ERLPNTTRELSFSLTASTTVIANATPGNRHCTSNNSHSLSSMLIAYATFAILTITSLFVLHAFIVQQFIFLQAKIMDQYSKRPPGQPSSSSNNYSWDTTSTNNDGGWGTTSN
ncbi:hypothetical protein PHLCEN_2v7168, partial [Hermanssonia centrifuga]